MHLPRLAAALAVFAGAAALTPQAMAAGADGTSPLKSAADAYRAAYPQLTSAAAATAAAEQPARKALYASVPLSQYGGAWYDAPSNTVHINATTQAAADAAEARGRELDLDVVTKVVPRTFADLQRQADSLRSDNPNVGIDVKANRVVTAAPNTDVVEDACTARNQCDTSVRAGIRVWRGTQGTNICSVGFTGRDFATNDRWMILAGHCTGTNGILVTWGTWNGTIGPMIASINSGAVDASAVWINDAAYSGQAGGQIYRDVAFGGTVRVDGAADLLTDMTIGDTVCLSANTTDLNGPNLCGVLGSISDPAVRGMARIDGMDACGGDSGGGWYGLSGSTRTAYGIHSRSNSTCHAAGGDSWFTPWASVKSNLVPNVDIET
jgi:streptogrisin C